VSKILYLQQTYHFGPGKIADYLKRFHQLSVAVSSVHRILVRHGMNRLPANQRYRSHVVRMNPDDLRSTSRPFQDPDLRFRSRMKVEPIPFGREAAASLTTAMATA
jgi:hypothetical protein